MKQVAVLLEGIPCRENMILWSFKKIQHLDELDWVVNSHE